MKKLNRVVSVFSAMVILISALVIPVTKSTKTYAAGETITGTDAVTLFRLAQ